MQEVTVEDGGEGEAVHKRKWDGGRPVRRSPVRPLIRYNVHGRLPEI